jgi:hypothetical protein
LNLSSTFLQAILRRSNFCTLGSFRWHPLSYAGIVCCSRHWRL